MLVFYCYTYIVSKFRTKLRSLATHTRIFFHDIVEYEGSVKPFFLVSIGLDFNIVTQSPFKAKEGKTHYGIVGLTLGLAEMETVGAGENDMAIVPVYRGVEVFSGFGNEVETLAGVVGGSVTVEVDFLTVKDWLTSTVTATQDEWCRSRIFSPIRE